MGVQAAGDDADPVALDERADLVDALRGSDEVREEIEHVLGDLEAETHERPVHEAVEGVVELRSGDQEDDHDAQELEDLLDRRRDDGHDPADPDPRAEQLDPQLHEAVVRRERERQHRDGAPQERADHQREWFALEQVEVADQQERRHREQRQEHGADDEGDRRVAQVVGLLAHEEDRADSQDGDEQPEGRLARLEEAGLVAPVGHHDGGGRRGGPGPGGRGTGGDGRSGGGLRDHCRTSIVSTNSCTSPRDPASWPCGAYPFTMMPIPLSETCVLSSPLTAVPMSLKLAV